MRALRLLIFCALAVPALPVPAAAAAVSLAPVKDNTLYETVDGSLSNGSGQNFFTGTSGGGAAHRGLVAFDIAGSIPPGATIDAVTLTLHMSRTSSATAQNVSLHPVLADWGEGTSDAPGNEGGGAPSTSGDATWLHTFYPSTMWSSAGGDFGAASATIAVGDTTYYAWSGAGLVSDVQSWLDTPAGNFGWILVSNEASPSTSKRFDSRENPVDVVRPVLEIAFTPQVPATAPGAWPLLLALLGGGAWMLRRRLRTA